MKKTILMGMAALMLCGTVNATSWRVCSKPEAGANFISVADAVASNLVFAGDTLYVEPGHVEYAKLTLNKQLIIIGPGFLFDDNNINSMNPTPASFSGVQYGTGIEITAVGTKIIGCCISHEVEIKANNVELEGCLLNGGVEMGRIGSTIRGCFFNNCNLSSNSYHIATTETALIENNIINGTIGGYYQDNCWYNCVFRNNVVVTSHTGHIFGSLNNCEVYNNIIINTSNGYTTQTVNQITDTTWNRNKTIDHYTSCNIHNNIFSSTSNTNFLNCVFNAAVENVLIWYNANSEEEKYKHIANGPAVGAGVNGTTCGAYGQVNGGRAYQPAGIPQYRPYIYDANIDETPSSSNTINASFKIKVQQ